MSGTLPQVLAQRRPQLLGSLLRHMLSEGDPGPEALRSALDLTIGRVAAQVSADLVALIDLDLLEGQARVVTAVPGPGFHCAACTCEGECTCRAGLPDRARVLSGATYPREAMGFLAADTWLEQSYVIESVPADLPLPRPLVEAFASPVGSLAAAPQQLSTDRCLVLVALHDRPGSAGGFSKSDRELLEDVVLVAGRALLQAGTGRRLNEADRTRLMCNLAGCAVLEWEREPELSLSLLESIGERLLCRYAILPLAEVEPGELRIAVADPLDFRALSDFEAVSGYKVAEKVGAPESWVRHTLGEAFAQVRDQVAEEMSSQSSGRVARAVVQDQVLDLADHLRDIYDTRARTLDDVEVVDEASPPVVRLANQLIQEAHALDASDIHLEAHENALVVRYRIDGTCRERLRLPKQVCRPLVSRLKIMSELDIAEHRLPQDGRLSFGDFDPSVDIDLRVSILPMLHGECVCMRLLDKHRSMLPLADLGYSDKNLETYNRLIRIPYGMLLHCGPTGSGKSMTLYAALHELNDSRLKIVTAEDPVEYTLAGVNQMPIRPGIGLTFASALRRFLRHDPDVILVGEIRDSETARLAIEASLTGHLLLSTLHTNDAASALPRLVKLKVEEYLVASTLIGVCAQRLVRRLCLGCRKKAPVEGQDREHLGRGLEGPPPSEVYVPGGCPECQHSGYRGRIGVHELLEVTPEIRELIMQQGTALQIKQLGRQQGMRTIFEDCMEKARDGISSMDEAFRVTRADEVA